MPYSIEFEISRRRGDWAVISEAYTLGLCLPTKVIRVCGMLESNGCYYRYSVSTKGI